MIRGLSCLCSWPCGVWERRGSWGAASRGGKEGKSCVENINSMPSHSHNFPDFLSFFFVLQSVSSCSFYSASSHMLLIVLGRSWAEQWFCKKKEFWLGYVVREKTARWMKEVRWRFYHAIWQSLQSLGAVCSVRDLVTFSSSRWKDVRSELDPN